MATAVMAFALCTRMFTLRRGVAAVVAGGSAGYAYDYHFKYQRLHRNMRSLVAAVLTVYDYKICYSKAQTPEDESRIHDRVAKRWFDVCSTNGGLYVKLGQAVTTMGHVLPPEYLEYFTKLHDQAPQCSSEVVWQLIREDLGHEPEELFKTFDKSATASASIAQVHRATLQDGTPVAVKVQKPWIAVQMPWDLLCYRTLVWALDWYFELPMYWTTEEACRSIRLEADFEAEARHSELAAAHWAASPCAENLYVPKVYWNWTSRRIMTQEWVEGIKINQLGQLAATGFDRQKVAETMISAFADQIFRSGFVHGDPHPGNLLVRWAPTGTRRMQLVVLDHGMYTSCSAKFKSSYSRLWKAMVLGDLEEMTAVCTEWGVADSEMFASFQLFKPFNASKSPVLNATSKQDVLQHAQQMRVQGYDRAKALLSDSSRTPTELVVLGRQMNIVRANNACMGAPANRVSIMAKAAALALYQETTKSRLVRGWSSGYWMFHLRLFAINAAYHIVQLRAKLATLLGGQAANFEEVLQRNMTGQLEAQLGIKLRIQEDQTWESVTG